MPSPAKLGCLLVLTMATLALQGCLEAARVEAKASNVRAALSKIETREDFVRAAESRGLKCWDITSQRVICAWTEPFRPNDPAATLGLIQAAGEFIDGRKSSDYEVKVAYISP